MDIHPHIRLYWFLTTDYWLLATGLVACLLYLTVPISTYGQDGGQDAESLPRRMEDSVLRTDKQVVESSPRLVAENAGVDFKVVHSPLYFADIGQHIMPIRKFQMVRDRLVQERIVSEGDIITPEPVAREDLLRVHTTEYVNAMETGTPRKLAESQTFPWSPELARAVTYTNGGVYTAARYALEHNTIAGNLASGFHHAMTSRGEGFCTFNGLAVAIRKLQAEGVIKKAVIIDTDLHYGNGTAEIFANDPSVYAFSLFGQRLGRFVNVDTQFYIEAPRGATNEQYLEPLRKSVPMILDSFKPDIIIYQAGADPYREDPMSPLEVDQKGLAERDRFVFTEARKRNIPVAYVLAGGYTTDTSKVVGIHVNTARAAIEVLREYSTGAAQADLRPTEPVPEDPAELTSMLEEMFPRPVSFVRRILRAIRSLFARSSPGRTDLSRKEGVLDKLEAMQKKTRQIEARRLMRRR